MGEKLNLDILTKTLNDLPVGVGVFNVEDLNDLKSIRYVFMNKVILHEMRKTKEEVFGKRVIEVAPEAYSSESGLFVLETYRKIAEEGGSINLGLVEYSNHMVAGTYECSVRHINGNYVYVMIRNVTELESTKIDLERKNEELSQFAHLASHDLKAPLATVTNAIDLILTKNNNKLPDDQEKLLKYALDATSRMDNLLNVLLDYGKIGHGKTTEKVNSSEILNEVKSDLANMIESSGAVIETGELPEVNVFKTEFRLVFQNLISNAIKFRKDDLTPKIKITAKKQEPYWLFEIEDNGIGMEKKNETLIFSIFQRLHDKQEAEGSGIGLAHCKKIIDLHHGEIWVESEVGKGSVFKFTIPIEAH